MLISFSRQFIFIHIYKVAGTSVREALSPYAWKPRQLLVNRLARKISSRIRLPFDRCRRALPYHATAWEGQQHYSARTYDRFFKFAFVRNPWDWQVSLYHFMRQCEDHKQYEMTRTMSGFEEYLYWRIREDKTLQKEFVTDDEGNLIVDFIG